VRPPQTLRKVSHAFPVLPGCEQNGFFILLGLRPGLHLCCCSFSTAFVPGLQLLLLLLLLKMS
jgi:hypothetical protein